MVEMTELPEWLQELWNLKPSIARKAESDIKDYIKSIDSLADELQEESDLRQGAEVVAKAHVRTINRLSDSNNKFRNNIMILLESLKKSCEAYRTLTHGDHLKSCEEAIQLVEKEMEWS